MAVSNSLFSSQVVYSQELFMEVCRPVLRILNLFQGKKTNMLLSTPVFSPGLENPHSFSDLASRTCAQFANPMGNLSNEDGDGNENGKKAIEFYHQNNNFARASRFFVHFFAVVARLRRETCQFHISWKTRTRKNDFLFLFLKLDARRIF